MTDLPGLPLTLYCLGAMAMTLIPLEDGTFRAPMGDCGQDGPEPCPWPLDPLILVAAGPVPLGMYHCPYCGSMVVAGVPHPDYNEDEWLNSPDFPN